MATVLLSTVGAGILLAAAPALATPSPSAASAASAARTAPLPPFPHELTLKGVAAQKMVTARFGPSDFSPRTGYPDAATTQGWTAAASPDGEPLYAGIYNAVTETGRSIMLYCADATTATSPGVKYKISPSRSAATPNLGYVGTIVTNNYPATSAPTSMTSAADKAAAVQLAIWFFTNRVVADPTDPHRAAAAAIVSDALRRGPLKDAGVPKLALSGPKTVYVNQVGGPYEITGNAGDVIVSLDRGQLYADAAGRTPIANGSVVKSGSDLYLKASQTGPARMHAKGAAIVKAGSEAVYEPTTTAGRMSAQIALYQTLVMANNTTMQGSGAVNIQAMPAPVAKPRQAVVPRAGHTGTGTGTITSRPPSGWTPRLPVTPAAHNAPVNGMLLVAGILIGLGTLAMAATRRRRRTT